MGLSTGDSCGAGLICNANGACVSACFIDGAVVSPGLNPANTCQRCAPATSTTTWTNEPNTINCDDGDTCTNPDRCDGMGACVGTPRCPATTPECTPSPFSCACTTTPTDSCAGGTNNLRCMPSGNCGCMDDMDCAAGSQCGPTGVCQPCNTVDACGSTCERCRDLPQTIGEGNYYQCSGSTQPAMTACMITACAATRADCNGDDSDACEINLQTDAANCSACGMACDTGRSCTAGQCTCSPQDQVCPSGTSAAQTCQGTTCRCTSDGQCATGYVCSGQKCVRQ